MAEFRLLGYLWLEMCVSSPDLSGRNIERFQSSDELASFLGIITYTKDSSTIKRGSNHELFKFNASN